MEATVAADAQPWHQALVRSLIMLVLKVRCANREGVNIQLS
jgi:hypothetical protein